MLYLQAFYLIVFSVGFGGGMGLLFYARFGWAPSNGYLYQIAMEMEETGLLVGEWPDEQRTVRMLRKKEEGAEFYKIVSQSLNDRITQIHSYLHYILEFLRNE
ncbi:hypothetical protein [Sporosarcina cyprini]|uniref:hypothetical protein n=1 Tax=Sporosarcina cyprini TaxID=2910523 RepID=UPI001EDD820F|nr:hypothetical protein [Sporosarcina cyprini]MCG3087269.1 hypothetical protein [Sporosarcina cyprini]